MIIGLLVGTFGFDLARSGVALQRSSDFADLAFGSYLELQRRIVMHQPFTPEQLSSHFGRRYEITRQLGSGTFGVVYHAFDLWLFREELALKLLLSPHRDNPVVLERFRNEVLLARTLASPNIVQVYSYHFDTKSNLPSLAMEFVSGGTLRDLMRAAPEGRLPVSRVLALMRDILSGLSVAHSRNIIHRDLKPENILIDKKGSAKVTDFGVARFLEAEYSITRTAETVGTPAYMAPEQLLSSKVQPSCDLFSVGIIAFELLVGALPFTGDDFLSMGMKQLSAELPLEPLRASGVPESFISFLKRCTAKHPEQRFRDAREALSSFEWKCSPDDAARAQANLTEWVGARRTRRKRRRRLLFRRARQLGYCMAAALLVISIPLSHFHERWAYAAAEDFLTAEAFYGIRLDWLKKIYGVNISPDRPEELFHFLETLNPHSQLMIRTLLAAGADPNVKNSAGETFLQAAFKRGAPPDLITRLIEAGASPFAKGSQGSSVLELCLQLKDIECLAHLTAMAPIQRLDDKGNRPLHYGALFSSTAVAYVTSEQPNPALVANLPNDEGSTVLHLLMNPAVPWNGYTLASLSVSKPDPNRKNRLGQTPLIVALSSGEFRRGLALLNWHPTTDPNIPGPDGTTALQYAKRAGRSNVVAYLLARGAVDQ